MAAPSPPGPPPPADAWFATLPSVSPLSLGLGGIHAEVELPPELLDAWRAVLDGPAPAISADRVDLHYAITAEGPGRYSLERDHGGLRRAVEAEAAIADLMADLTGIVLRRRPGTVIVRAGVVAVGERAVVVIGPDGSGTSALLAALTAAGADLHADGLVAIEPSGRVLPTAIGPMEARPSGADRPAALPGALPVALIVDTTFVDGADWDPAEVTGARAVLPLLGHLVGPPAAAPETRALVTRLAEHVLTLRGPRPEADAVAADILARARRVEVPRHEPPLEATGAADPAEPEPVAARFVQFDDFLDPEGHARLLAFALAREPDFVTSSVTRPDEDPSGAYLELRRSRTLYDLAEVWDLFEGPITRLLPYVRRELDVPWFSLHHIERQLTVHGPGDHFTLHTDAGGPDTDTRMISAVYYFNREPRRFSGGALRLFDTVDRGGVIEPVATHTEIAPLDNRLVVFRSDAFHEVRPVEAESLDFADQRFTVVFWARKAQPVDSVFSGDPDTLTARQHQLVPLLTADGFRVIDTPPAVHARLRSLFEANRNRAEAEHSDATYLPSGDPSIIPVGEAGQEILEAMQGLHEEWYGGPLAPSAAYGIRVYGEGQTLRRHCDRVGTHVVSSVVHIAADTDEPWPLRIEDAAGQAHDIVLEPGQTLLYESAKLPHSRPTPLRGRYYASVFLHFRPVDWEATLAGVCRDAAGPGGGAGGALTAR